MRLHIIGILLFAFWLNGCTITKRVHRDGYHVEWHKRHKNDVREKVSNAENYYSELKSASVINEFALKERENVDSFSVMLIEEPKSNPTYASRQYTSSGFSQMMRKKDSISTKKAGTNIQLEKSKNNLANAWLKELLIYALISIGGILVILAIIWAFMTYPKTALLVLGIVVFIGLIAFQILMIIALINGDSIDLRLFFGNLLVILLGLVAFSEM